MAEKQTIIFEGIDKVTPVANGIKTSFAGLQTAAAAFGAVLLTGVIAKGFSFMIAEAAESQKVFSNLENALKNVTGTSKETAYQVDSLSKSLSAASAFTDEELNTAFTRLVQITQDVSLSTKSMQIAMDFARATGQSLLESTQSIGRALEGNTRGLKQYGINIREGATETEILSAVQKRFAGASEKYINTLSGQWDLLKTNISNVAETMGNAIAPLIEAGLKKVNAVFDTSDEAIGKKLIKDAQDIWNRETERHRNGLYTDEYMANLEKELDKQTEIGKKLIQKAKDIQNELNGTQTEKSNTQNGGAGYAAAAAAAGAKSGQESFNESLKESINLTNQYAPIVANLGQAIGQTAAGSTKAWHNFAQSSLIAFLDFIENAIKAQGALALATGNLLGVGLSAAGIVAVEGLKGGISMSMDNNSGASNFSPEPSGYSSGSGVNNASVSSPSSTNLTIQLFNPVFMSRESQLNTINDMLNLAASNGWNITRNDAVSIAG